MSKSLGALRRLGWTASDYLEGDSSGDPYPVEHLFVSRAIYGLITVLAVLEVMELHPPTAWHAAASLFGATLAVALIEAYADSIAQIVAHGKHLSRQDVKAIGHDVAPVMIGAQTPTLIMLLAVLGLISVERAIDLGQVVAFVSLFLIGWRIGGLLNGTTGRRLVSGLMLVLIGGLLVLIKASFH